MYAEAKKMAPIKSFETVEQEQYGCKPDNNMNRR